MDAYRPGNSDELSGRRSHLYVNLKIAVPAGRDKGRRFPGGFAREKRAMNDHSQVYEALAGHLDQMPEGYPRTPTDVEIRILRKLFSPEEAALALKVTLRPEPPGVIAARAALDPQEAAQRLYDMSRKGLIYRLRKGEQVYYMAAQFIIGIWEFHVNDLDPELIRDVNEYIPYFFQQDSQRKNPQLRTIPIGRAIPAQETILPYEEARRILASQEKIVIAPCICRKEHQMLGKGCHRPMESCFVFGVGAQYYEENSLGRPISHGEAFKILREAEDAGLVLQPSNSRQVVNICTCCGCCCQILKNLKTLPAPALVAATNFYAVLDTDRCTGCETCMSRCQMEAIRMEGSTAFILRERCIGCGLCVPTCPEEALRLEHKPEEERYTPPHNRMERFRRITAERMAKAGRPMGDPHAER